MENSTTGVTKEMKKSLIFFWAVCHMAFGVPVIAADHPELKVFPAASEGRERFVIVLPHKEREEEDDFMVELIAGKIMPADSVNRMRLGNSIEPRTLEGWGYTY